MLLGLTLSLGIFILGLLVGGKPCRVALVAVAGKLARRVWAVLYYGVPYRRR